MRRTIAVVTPPATEPVTLEEAKQWARIDDTTDDALIAALVTTAKQAVELYLKRALITQTIKLSVDLESGRTPWVSGYFEMPVSAFFDPLPRQIELARPPIQSISSVVTYSTANTSSTYSPAKYTRIDSRLVLNDTAEWPSDLRGVGTCEITYVAGYGDASAVPQPIRTAILMTAAALYDSRGSCDGNGLAPGASRMLNPYRVMDGLLG